MLLNRVENVALFKFNSRMLFQNYPTFKLLRTVTQSMTFKSIFGREFFETRVARIFLLGLRNVDLEIVNA